MRRLLVLIGIVAALSACSREKLPPVPLEDIDIPLRGASIMADINGDPYRYFRYDSVESTRADLAKVARDGSKIDGVPMPWDGPVRIYYRKERIVIYVGDNEDTIAAIETVFGDPVAGDQ